MFNSWPTPPHIMALLLLYLSSKLTSVMGDIYHDTLERFLYEGAAPDGQNLFLFLRNCSLNGPREGGFQSTTTEATWLRMAYHDSSTFNITDQTGGVDGSIHFELDRAENIGDGLKTTQTEYSSHSNKYISLADVIAIGAAAAVASCGGPIIPWRAGRVDAKKAGNPGVPEPEQDLQTHIEKFRLQGFNATEMIELVACGHTLGGVESQDFPTIVDLPPNKFNVSVSAPFDNTTAFDTTVVTQYLNDRTQNPLVVGKNVTTRSDFRIFNSDGNVTMRALADPATFQKRCGILFERMINTVPSGVKLTEPIELIPALPHATTGLRIGNNSLTFEASLRLAGLTSDPVVDKSRVSLYWCDRYGQDANCQSGFSNRVKGAGNALVWKGSPFMTRAEKNFRVYPFQAPIDSSRSVSQFWWEIEQEGGGEPIKVDNGGEKYPILHDDIVYLNRVRTIQSTSSQDGKSRTDNMFVVIGVRDTIEPTRVYVDLFDYAYNGRQPGSVTNATFNLVRNASIAGAPGYNIYSAAFDTSSGGGPTFDFYVEAPEKTHSLLFQPASFGDFPPQDLNLITEVGTVERVVYTAAPKAGPSNLPGSATDTLSLPLQTQLLMLLTLTLISGFLVM